MSLNAQNVRRPLLEKTFHLHMGLMALTWLIVENNLMKKILLKFLNPFIWSINTFNYFCHMEKYINNHAWYIPYDFSKDLKYF